MAYGYYNGDQWVDTSITGAGGEGVGRLPSGFQPTSFADWGSALEKSNKLIGTDAWNSYLPTTDPQWSGIQTQMKADANRNVDQQGMGFGGMLDSFKNWVSNPGVLMALGGIGGALGAFGAAGAAPTALEAGNLSSLGSAWGGTAGAAGSGLTGAAGTGLEALEGGGSGIAQNAVGQNLGLDMSRLTDPSYWNELGGTTGLAEPGAAGVAGSTSTYGGNDLLSKVINTGGNTPMSALQKILSGSSTTDDWLSLAGKVAPGILAALGSGTQSSAYKALADKYGQYGLPALGRLEASYAPGFDVSSLPGLKGAMDTASGSLLSKLSATGGNPYGQPGGLIEANKQILNGVALPALNNYRAQNLQQAGLGIGPAYGADAAAVQNNGGLYTGLSSAIGAATAPQNDLASLLAMLKGLNLGTTPV